MCFLFSKVIPPSTWAILTVASSVKGKKRKNFDGIGIGVSTENDVVFCVLFPRHPITLSEDDEGVYNHLGNARYLGSITILRR